MDELPASSQDTNASIFYVLSVTGVLGSCNNYAQEGFEGLRKLAILQSPV